MQFLNTVWREASNVAFVGVVILGLITTKTAMGQFPGRVLVADQQVVQVYSFVFLPDGQRIVASSDEFMDQNLKNGIRTSFLRIWSLKTGKELKKFEVEAPVKKLVLRPDGKTLIGSMDREGKTSVIGIWDLETGKLQRMLDGHQRDCSIHSISISPDGKWIASVAPGDERILLWNFETGESRTVVRVPIEEFPIFANFSPDGKLLIVGCLLKGGVSVRHLDRDESFDLSRTDTVGISGVAFSPDGRWLATAGRTNYDSQGKQFPLVWIWDCATWKVVHDMTSDEPLSLRGVRYLSFSPDGALLASGREDTLIQLWDVKTGRLLKSLANNARVAGELSKSTPIDLVFSPDGSDLGCITRDVISIWSVKKLLAASQK